MALSREIDNLKATDDIKRKSIVSTAERDVRSITSKRDSELLKLTLSTRSVTEDLERKLDSTKQAVAMLGNCISFSDGILGRGKDEDVLMLESILTDRIAQLQESVAVSYPLDISSHQELNQKTDEHDVVTTPTSSNKPLVTLTHVKTLFTKCNTDTEKQDIKGMVYSSKTGIVVSDHLNGKIKIISKTGDLVKVITKSDFYPHAVAVTGRYIGAIDGNSLLIFTLKGNISSQVHLTDKNPEPHLASSLVVSQAGGFGFVVGNIAGEDKLRFYSTNGMFERNLYCSVKCPLAAMSVTPKRNLVLSEWGSGQLRAITPGGKLVFRINKKNWQPNGTCMSRDGLVYIADYNAGGVSVYNSKTEALEVVYTTESDGISSPQFVALDESGQLYVGDSSGIICVYKCSR